jgi:hypothetical protein
MLMPGQAAHARRKAPRTEWSPKTNDWNLRLGGLIAGVSISGSAILGGVAALIPLAFVGDAEDGTPYVGSIAAGPTLITFGSVALVATATVLAHHVRWDRPRADGRYPDPGGRWAAHRARRQLRIALAVFGGLAVVGGASIGLSYAAAARACGSRDLGCAQLRWEVGYGVGGPLVAAGAFGSFSSGILLGMHRRHRHDRAPRIEPGAGTIAIRF